MISYPFNARRIAGLLILAAMLLCAISSPALSSNQTNYSDRAAITSSDNQGIALSFKLSDLQREEVVTDDAAQYSFTIKDESYIMENGRPKLPSVSRTVIVPPGAGLEFVFRSDEPRIETANNSPVIFTDGSNAVTQNFQPLTDIYPPAVAQMSEPFIIRGVRMVRVTTYPVRYDPVENTYLHYDNVETEIRFTNAEPVNPVHHPVRRNRSQSFLKFIEAFALNGSDVRRDDPDRDVPDRKPGHYLIVAHEACLEFVAPFIEWRRKGGYKVDILTFNPEEALNPEIVSEGIQEIYFEYLEQGVDPFDHILLVGDRSQYAGNIPEAQWVLEAPLGSTAWQFENHADYLYACLEGNDEHMDAAISRFPAGNPATLSLVVGRTLAYEAEPFMEDPAWFTRGAAFSQHAGNGAMTYWTPYLHTCVRWGEEVLRRQGFDDIAVYENMDWELNGAQIHPFLRDVYNEGRNILVGSANSFQWRQEFQDVNDNVIFPIQLCFSEHSDLTSYVMFRTGDGNHLRGPVAISGTCGDIGNVEPICVQWLGLVSAFMDHDLTFGWSRVYAVTDLEAYFPNVDFANNLPLYQQAKTDFDFMGDPGIQAWIGVPRLVEAQLSLDEISPTTSYVEVMVTDAENGEPVSGANVSIYAPGEIPEFDDAGYADFDEMFQMTTISDDDGIALFHFDDGIEFLPGTRFNYTVTGRDIRPFFGDVRIDGAPVAVEVINFEFVQVGGNGDAEMNPGETFGILFTARNISEEENLNAVTAIVTSFSEWIEIDENEIDFGDLAPGDEIAFEQGVNFVIAADCPDGELFPDQLPMIQIEFSSGDRTWQSAIEIDPVAPGFVLNEVVGGDRIPFDLEELDIEIENAGRMEAGALMVELISGGRSIWMIRAESAYPNIAVGERATLNGELFQLNVNPQTIPGIKAKMILELTAENGFRQQIPFTLQPEMEGGNFPQAPDDYGYICFDDTDEDWTIAPVYEWVEISLNEDDRDFNGELLGFDGESEFDIGEALVVDLPFETQFYGEEFEQITVCTKGFIAMGNQPRITNYQASPLDRAMGGGMGMIAPFWGDLTFEDNTGIYSFYDEENARFIIEWYQTSHLNEERDNLTFQVILYDPEVWMTESGDANILFQYQSIADLRNLRDVEWLQAIPFAAVGISSPDGTTGINYSFNNTLPQSSAPLEDGRAILFSTGFEFRAGRIFGTVTDFETGEPIDGAGVGGGNANENGEWEIPEVIADVPFHLTCSAPGYNDSTLVDLIVEEDGELEVNFALLHPEFECSVNEFAEELIADEIVNLPFELRNDGNGPLEWETDEQWRGGGNNTPWDLLRQYMVGQITGDSRLQGVVFANDRFYLAGSNNRNPLIYVLNREGELIDQFAQFGQGGGYGYKDLAFDGEWTWGSGGADIYAFTPEGELMREFEGPFNPTNNLAWDPDRELLWVSSTTSNIIAIDREGNDVNELNRMGLRIYGLSYYPDDIDGYPLYVFHKDVDIADLVVTKMDPETNDTMFVCILEPEAGGDPAASFCTNQYDPQIWAFICIVNDGPNDRIDIWQIDNRFDWFELNPVEGTVNAGESQEMVLTLDATGVPVDFRFAMEIVFHHNARGGEFFLPVTLDVLGNERALQLDLIAGWNMISFNVEPEDLDVREIMRPLVEDDLLLLLKNGAGDFYLPIFNFCNIDGWEVVEGYQLNVTEAAQLDIRGAFIPEDQPIPLREGWNMSAYFPRQAVNAEVALAGIADQLIIAKDGLGRFYLPQFGFSNMGNLRAGQGYQYNMREADELVYQLGEQVAVAVVEIIDPEHFGSLTPTGTDMSVLVAGEKQMSGYELACFGSGGRLIGSGCFDSEGRCGLAVWGDDVTTDAVDGALSGEILSFILWDGVEEIAVTPLPVTGESVWTAGGFMLGEVTSEAATPVTFGIHETYPNPTNGPVRLSFGLEKDATVSLCVYDLSGRLVTTLVSGEYKAGNHQIVWNTDVVSSGLYLVKLAVPGRSHTEKIAVLK